MKNNKLIAGVPHKYVPCQICDEFIWVNVRCFAPICTDCSLVDEDDMEPETQYGVEDRACFHDYQYHGSYTE